MLLHWPSLNRATVRSFNHSQPHSQHNPHHLERPKVFKNETKSYFVVLLYYVLNCVCYTVLQHKQRMFLVFLFILFMYKILIKFRK